MKNLMFNKIKIALLVTVLSVLVVADNNSTKSSNNVDINLSKMSKAEFAKSDYIRVRFVYFAPFVQRVVCKQLCKKECMEPVKMHKGALNQFSIIGGRASRSIGMTETANSKKVLAKGISFWNPDNYFDEYEILKDGEFYFVRRDATSTVSFNVVLLKGHEYEVVAGSSVYMINPDGSTTPVKTMYPSTCGLFDAKDKVFPVLSGK